MRVDDSPYLNDGEGGASVSLNLTETHRLKAKKPPDAHAMAQGSVCNTWGEKEGVA